MHGKICKLRIQQAGSTSNALMFFACALDTTASNKTSTLPARPHRLTSLDRSMGIVQFRVDKPSEVQLSTSLNDAPFRLCLNFAEFTKLTSVFRFGIPLALAQCESYQHLLESRCNRENRWFRRVNMAKVIEFYVPDLFPRKVKWGPSEQRGQVVEFPKSVKK
jgi:hypothetical protein